MGLFYLRVLLLLGLFSSEFGLASKCLLALDKQIKVADLNDVSSIITKVPEKEWARELAKLGVHVPEAPLALQRWGTEQSRLAYRSYLVKQALGKRTADFYDNLATKLEGSEVLKPILNDPVSGNAVRENLSQILLALAGSGDVSLQKGAHCLVECQTKVGKNLYSQLERSKELESFPLDDEKVGAWVKAISELIKTKPDLWNALQSRVRGHEQIKAVQEFFSERGFEHFAQKFRNTGWFLSPEVVNLRNDSQSILGVDVKDIFSNEKADCCATSCGACPLAFPSVLKVVQKNLQERNQTHIRSFNEYYSSPTVKTLYSEELKTLKLSLEETYKTMNDLSAQSFGIFTVQDKAWIDDHFRRGVMEAELDFLHGKLSDVVRHARHDEGFRSSLKTFLSHPLIVNHHKVRDINDEFQQN